MEAPRVHYAAARRGKVAFQDLGSGRTPLVLVPPLAQHIEMMWEQPAFWRPIQRLASGFRFVQYDKLGTGLSDPVAYLATLDDRLQELEAVLDAAGIERAWLAGLSEGGVIALAAAERLPARVEGLVLISTYSGASALGEAGAFGPVPAPADFRSFFGEVVARWGTSHTVTLRDFAPTLGATPALSRWAPRYERASASPAMIGTLMQSGFALDATALLPRISQKALVVHLEGDRVIPVAFGRMLGARLKNARYVELPGDDHFAWVSPAVDDVIDHVFAFAGVRGTGQRVKAPWDPWSTLTPSERRVALLAQRGMTNTEIAGSLRLSARTVENHLSRAYSKLGVRSRTELALMQVE